VQEAVLRSRRFRPRGFVPFLDKWLLAIREIANCSNGISSVELGKKIGVTQESA
jgi:hypothetical protein